jgi:hypothetical protein
MESQNTTQTDTNTQSAEQQSSSPPAGQPSETALNEAPLENITQAPKPLSKMTDAELSAWHAKLREKQLNPQKLAAHLRALPKKKQGKGKGKAEKPEEEVTPSRAKQLEDEYQ